MPANLPESPEKHPSPERDLQRRSGTPAVNPWLIVGLILILGAVVYVVSALL